MPTGMASTAIVESSDTKTLNPLNSFITGTWRDGGGKASPKLFEKVIDRIELLKVMTTPRKDKCRNDSKHCSGNGVEKEPRKLRQKKWGLSFPATEIGSRDAMSRLTKR